MLSVYGLGKRKDKLKGPLIAALLLSVVGVGVSAPSGVSAAPPEPGAAVAPQTSSPLGLFEATNDLVRLAPGQVPAPQPGWPPALAPGALPAPQQLEPASGAHTTGNPADPTPGRVLYRPLGVPCFRWGSVAGATKYELQVSEVQQDTAIVLSKTDVRQTAYCPTAYDFSGHGIQDGWTYFWRVRAYGGTPVAWGDWSAWRGFTRHWASVPVPSWPTMSPVLTRPPVLSWTPVDGTEYYKLEVSSDPDFPDPQAQTWPNFTWKLTTRNPAFALATQGSSKLPNDEDIYWRVRAVGGANVGEEYRWGAWSASGDFGLCWSCNLVPELGAGNERRPLPLTPVNLENHVHSAYFSWAPVEGAKAYEIEMSENPSFDASGRLGFFSVANPGLLAPIEANWAYDINTSPIYWRVRAKNYYDVYGEWNNETPNASASFFPERTWAIPISESIVPDLLFPEFYYKPVYTSSVWEDRTVAVPTFVWNQVPGALSYTIEVAANKSFTSAWTLTTENLSATPLVTESLQMAGVYYWRVRATDEEGPLPDSQRWETRVDQARRAFTPTAPPPRLVQPTYQLEGDGLIYGQQVLEHFPHLDWMPVSGADHYEVQIATSAVFTASLVETATTELTSYTPVIRYPPDTYYWRVQAKNSAGAALGGWSQVYYFALMRQFAPQALYSAGLEQLLAPFSAQALLTEDPLGDQGGGEEDEGYDLAALYTGMDNSFWYLGWSVYTSTRPVRFQLYLDPEGADGEGMTTNPYPGGGTLPNESEPYRPEYVLQWDMFGASGMPTVTLFSGVGSEWDYDALTDIGGRAVYTETSIYSDTAGFVLLAVPHTAIRSPATMNCLLVSVNPTTTQVVDTMDRGYVTVSTAPAPLTPPTSHVDDARHVVYPRMPLITWHTLTNIVNVRFRSNVDVSFSDPQTEYGRIPRDPMSFSGSNSYYLSQRVYPDNMTHYWQVLSRYKLGSQTLETTWSRPVRFTKRAQVPANLTISGAIVSGTLLYVDTTPVFSWGPVQGAAGYRFELIGGAYNETLHGSSSNSYIPAAAIPNGDYEWRVRIIDGSANWSMDNYASGRFQKGSDVPALLFPLDPRTITDTVYFRWTPLTGAAYYRVEVAADQNFSRDLQRYDKVNNTVFAPMQVPGIVTKGAFYWRVCGYNGSGHFMGCEANYIERYPGKAYLPVVLRNQR